MLCNGHIHTGFLRMVVNCPSQSVSVTLRRGGGLVSV